MLDYFLGNQPHLWNRTSLQCLQEFEKQRIEIQNECERKESGKIRLQHQQQPTPKNLSAQSLFSPVKTADSSNQGINYKADNSFFVNKTYTKIFFFLDTPTKIMNLHSFTRIAIKS